MSLYHQTPYTLRPEVVIPQDATLAIGTTVPVADEIQRLSDEYVGGNEVRIDVVMSTATYATCTIDYHGGQDLPPDASVRWSWGDRRSETGHDLIQGHEYGAFVGTPTITIILERPAQPSMSTGVRITVPDPGP